MEVNKRYLLILTLAFLQACAFLPEKKLALNDISIEKINGMPYLWATVNEKRYQFLLDTGSTDFLLTDELVKDAGLIYSKTNTMTASGITGVINLKTVDKVSFRLDNGVVLNVSNVAVVDKKGFSLFPYKFLEILNTTWDVKNSKLIFNKI
jgi:predicted aspartyl protease